MSGSSGGQQRGERQEKGKVTLQVDSALSVADCSLPIGHSNLILFPDGKDAPLAEFLEYLTVSPQTSLNPNGNDGAEKGLSPSFMPLGAAVNIPLPAGGSFQLYEQPCVPTLVTHEWRQMTEGVLVPYTRFCKLHWVTSWIGDILTFKIPFPGARLSTLVKINYNLQLDFIWTSKTSASLIFIVRHT